MTENELREKVVEKAVQWLGRNEANGSHKEIIDVYNEIRPLPRGYRMKYTDPWCAAFVSAVAQALGLTHIIFPECGCDAMIALYKAAGRYTARESGIVIQPGDLIFYDWNKDGSSDHVGIIIEITASGYRVIEGNKSDSVSTRTVLRNYNLIRGFGLPNYAAEADEEEDDGMDEIPVEETAAPEESFELTHHVLRRGDGMGTRLDLREEVRSIQRLLKALGFDLGRWGTDGEFGDCTKQAVIAFQRSVRLPASGEVDRNTTAALCGVR